jgi:hypothetical protein
MTLEDLEIKKTQCFNLTISKKDLADLSFSGLHTIRTRKMAGSGLMLIFSKSFVCQHVIYLLIHFRHILLKT